MGHEAWSDSRKMNHSMQFRPIEVQRALNQHAGFNPMQWLELQAHLTLRVTCTLRNCVVLTRAFIKICSSCTLGIGRWRKNKYHLFMICRELQGGSLLVTYWAAEQRLAFRFYLFKLSWWKSVHTIYFNIQLFGCPIIQVDQNVVKSALEPLWIWVCSRKGGIQVSRSCRSSAESLSRSWLLMFALSSCSLIMEPERHKLFQDLGNVLVWTYQLVKIQLSVVTYRQGVCIYGKCVVDTFLQWMSCHGAWQLWHFGSGLHIPIKHRFRC